MDYTYILRITLQAYSPKILVKTCSTIVGVLDRQPYNGPISLRYKGPIPFKYTYLGQPVPLRYKGPVALPTRRRIYCVLRSPHVNKDSREHFEVRIHKRFIDVEFSSFKNLFRDFLNHLGMRELALGVGISFKVKREGTDQFSKLF